MSASTGLLSRPTLDEDPHSTSRDESEPEEDQSRWRRILFGQRAEKKGPKPPKIVTSTTMGRRTDAVRWIVTGALALVSDATQLNAVRQFYPDASRLPVDGVDLYAARTATVDLDAVATGFYTAVVSVDVLEDYTDDDEGYVDAGTRFYPVGIQQLESGFVATSLPAQIAAPPTLLVPNRVLPELGRPDGDVAELADALGGFFTSYLTGQGDLDRYADLSSGLTRVDPAPFDWAAIGGISARLRSGDLWLVQVEVLAGNDSGTQNFHYSLDVVEGNRWEVLRVLPGLPHQFTEGN